MSVGRRPVLLAIGFSVATMVLTDGLLRAQVPTKAGAGKAFLLPPPMQPPKQTSKHPWDSELTPDDVKAALGRLEQGGVDGDPSSLQQLLQVLKENPKLAEQLNQMMMSHPELRKQVEEKAKQAAGKMTKEDAEKLLKEAQSNLPATPPAKEEPPTRTQELPKGPGVRPPTNPPGFQPPKQGPGGRPPILPDVPEGVFTKLEGPPPPGVGMPDPVGPGGEGGAMSKTMVPPNPFGQPELDPRAKSMSAVVGWWEKYVGPLDDTPEVKKALEELVNGDSGLNLDPSGNGESLWDWLKGDGGNDLSNAMSGGGSADWGLGKWDLPDWGIGKWFEGSPSNTHSTPGSSSSSSSSSSGGSSGGSLFGGWGGGGGGSWLPFALLAVAILAAVVLSWWYLKDPDGRAGGSAGARLGPWPLDPRAINTRQDVVKAFEYLSVLLCGPAARMWTHGTVAEALSGMAAAAGDATLKLARLYELARYAPLDEPLTRPEVIEARHLVCDLAGVS